MVNNFNNFSIDIALTNAQDFEAGREFSKESIFEGKFRVLAPSDEKIKEEEKLHRYTKNFSTKIVC